MRTTVRHAASGGGYQRTDRPANGGRGALLFNKFGTVGALCLWTQRVPYGTGKCVAKQNNLVKTILRRLTVKKITHADSQKQRV